MFEIEEYRHLDLIPALKVHNLLLNYYRARLRELGVKDSLEEIQRVELTEMKGVILSSQNFIEAKQKERDELLSIMHSELVSWSIDRLSKELDKRESAYSSIPADAREDDKPSMILLGFTRPFVKERQYLIDRMNELAEKLKDTNLEVNMDYLMEVRRSIAGAGTEDELWLLLNEHRQKFPMDDLVKSEYLFYRAIKAIRQRL